MATTSTTNFNPIIVFIGLIIGVMFVMGTALNRTFGGRVSYKRRRQLARARAAKRRKGKKRRK